MKVDGLGVVLAIILLPIILVVTYYIQIQVDTIAKENQYNTNLLTATYDALSAFEMNTANEDLSSVADSLRSIIEASNNIFLNSLATSLGMSNASKELLQPYIPAVLYTMYDGYYIYAPTMVPVVAAKKETVDGLTTSSGYLSYGDKMKDGTELIYPAQVDGAGSNIYGDLLYETESGAPPYTTKRDNARKEADYILKSYVQYSAHYKTAPSETAETTDVTINYTLDNYLNIEGKIGNIYYTKTGYLIKSGLVTMATLGADLTNNILETLGEDDAKRRILGLKNNNGIVEVQAEDSASVTISGMGDINSNFKTGVADKLTGYFNAPGRELGIEILTMADAEDRLNEMYKEYYAGNTGLLTTIQDIEYEMQKCKAVAYYASSQIFSNWVYANLGGLKETHLDQITSIEGYKLASGITDTRNALYYQFTDDGTSIFNTSVDPESQDSKFYKHKLEVIKNSIKYNLNMAISVYTKMMNNSYNFSLPVLEDSEWDKILSNISIVSFMQGWDCGLNIYNNYQIASSTNNELMVTPSEIYYVEKDKFNNATDGVYHRIDCPVWETPDSEFISFKSKEVKYDKVYQNSTNSYVYDHRNTACYTCINTQNYNSLFPDPSADYYTRINNLRNASGAIDTNRRLAGYIGLAQERQGTYKTSALTVSQGYRVFPQSSYRFTSNGKNFTRVAQINNVKLKDIKKVLVTINNVSSVDMYSRASFNVRVGDINVVNPAEITLGRGSLAIEFPQTLEIDVSENVSGNNGFLIEFQRTSPTEDAYNIGFNVQSVKVIYK